MKWNLDSLAAWLECLLFFIPLESMLEKSRAKNWRCHTILHAALRKAATNKRNWRFIDPLDFFFFKRNRVVNWSRLFLINTMCHIYRCMERNAMTRRAKSPWAVAVIMVLSTSSSHFFSPFLPFWSANMIFSLCRPDLLSLSKRCKVRHLITPCHSNRACLWASGSFI